MRSPWYCDEDVAFPPRASWMSTLSDELRLNQISIPGTHESCARRGGLAYVCQGLGLRGQLEAGIRFFDIRCFHDRGGFAIRHGAPVGEYGDIYQGYWFDKKYQFADEGDPCVLDVCMEFLKLNPRECIVMSIRPEPYDSDTEAKAAANGESFCDCVCKSIDHSMDVWYDAWGSPDPKAEPREQPRAPRLGDVRGKIVLIRSFEARFDPKWPTAVRNRALGFSRWGPAFHEQDEADVSRFSLDTKFNKVAMTSDRVRTQKLWYANFTSGSRWFDASEIAKSVNTGLAGYLQYCAVASGSESIGMLAMDFPGDGLVRRIIELNFLGRPPERRTLWLADEFDDISHPAGEDNHVDLPSPRTLNGLEVKYQPGYGIVNMRFFDAAGDVLPPNRPFAHDRYGHGWVSKDFDGEAPVRANGFIDGIQFAKHHQWGIVNVRVHLAGKDTWEDWLIPAAEKDGTAEVISEPRVLHPGQQLLWIETWREGGHGIVDARFAYRDVFLDYFLTTLPGERDGMITGHGYVDEGIAGYVWTSPDDGAVALHRLVGPNNDHFYTALVPEREATMAIGYNDEGVVGFVRMGKQPGAVPLYRLFGWGGFRLFTTSADEREAMINDRGYVDEGIPCFVAAQPEPGTVPLYRLMKDSRPVRRRRRGVN